MALAGHPVKVFIKNAVTSPSGSDEVDGLNSVEYSPTVDLLDVTDFKDTTGFKLKLAGLKDGSVSVSGDFEGADAPQVLLRTSWSSGSSVWATLHFDTAAAAGSRGFQVECKVESFGISANVDGKVEFTAALSFTDAPVVDPA